MVALQRSKIEQLIALAAEALHQSPEQFLASEVEAKAPQPDADFQARPNAP
jgi:hypothetical protein